MAETIVTMRAAKRRLSQLIALAKKGERVIIARAGKPVAELGPVKNVKRCRVPANDPLLRVDEYAFDGPLKKMTTAEIDQIDYDAA